MRIKLSAARPRSAAVAIVAGLTVGVAGQAAFAAGAPTMQSLEGVWKVTKVVRTGPHPSVNNNPQGGLGIVYRGYCSIVRDGSSEPRKASPKVDPATATDAEKIALYGEWANFGASAGACELKGDRLISHNVVAKAARNMTATEEATIKFEGPDTFVATGEGGETTYTRVR